MRPAIRIAVTILSLLISVLLPAQALGGSLGGRWTVPSGVIACHRAPVPETEPQVVTFSLSTEEATIAYVGERCMTLLIAGGQTNLTVGADLGTYYNVALTPSTVYTVGTKRVAFTHLFASPNALIHNAGPIEKITLIGRFDRNYAPLRATRILFLRKGQRLPN